MARSSPLQRFQIALAVIAALATGPLVHAGSPSQAPALVPETSDGQLPLVLRVAPGAAGILAERVRELGGTVTHRFENLDAIAVTLPADAAAALAVEGRIVATERQRVVRRTIVPVELPKALASRAPRRPRAGEEFAQLDDAEFRDARTAAPALRGSDTDSFFGYDLITGAAQAWKVAGQGDGIVVAIIDTGVYPDHPMISGNVVGGQNLVPAEEEQQIDANRDGTPEGLSFDWNAVENDGHGTFCAGLVAGHADLLFALDHPLVLSLQVHSPESVEIGEEGATIRLRGTAPGASLYAIKIFPYDGGPAPDARVAEAIDRLVTMKRNGELDVDVISMSLSGPVLFDGMNALDAMVDVATSFGITCVSAASNDGPSLVSVGSPGSAHSSLTVGAVLDPLHTRVAAEVAFGLPTGMGSLLDPYDDPMMIEFSSRGLTADRRVKPDLVATGFVVFSSGLSDANQDGVNDGVAFGFGSGTSFSTPTVAGAAALVTAYGDQLGGLGRAPFVANVLKRAAVPIASKEAVSEREQGRGFVHIPGALDLLQSGAYLTPGESDPSHTAMTRSKLALGPASGTTPEIGPGESYNVFLDVPGAVSKLEFEFPSVTLSTEQNPILGEALGAVIHSAKRGGSGDYVFGADAFSGGLQPGTTFELEDPEPGVLRLTFSSPAFNYGPASASWSVRAVREASLASAEFAGTLHQGDIVEHTMNVPHGLKALGIRLAWDHDWREFPTVDLDMMVTTPEGSFPLASIDSPETAVIEHPTAGEWTFRITDLGTALGPETYALHLVEVAPPFVRDERSDDEQELPRILAASPNPTRDATEIRFTLPASGRAGVDVFDVAGRVVRSLADGPRESGEHSVHWDGANDAGESVGAGVYFVRLQTKAGTSVRKMTRLE